ncbi:hypothetical protein GDO86_001839 [Hymenochirus boettgeri]|uniref:Uncharacterized protein n=1 Tax=Hymenochirus boettgeri TaxID=247094 RepID=A0A8T2KH74_9PIPI|nr:hypothetical protein GDO86_001839 [Hymenochirus boettgeri]
MSGKQDLFFQVNNKPKTCVSCISHDEVVVQPLACEQTRTGLERAVSETKPFLLSESTFVSDGIKESLGTSVTTDTEYKPHTEFHSQADGNTSEYFWLQESQIIQSPEISTHERISASQQMKSVIKRTKETPNVHPMYRDLSPRRKFGPAIYNKSLSQDRLIEELHGRFGIDKPETYKSPEDDWLTEGVIITSRPSKNLLPSEQQIEKIIIPPDSPQLMRKCFSVNSSSPGTIQKTRLVSKSTSPSQPSSCPPPPPPLPPLQSHVFSPHTPQPSRKAAVDDYQDLSRSTPISKDLSTSGLLSSLPLRDLPPTKSYISIGCQTDDTPLFPPIQAGTLLNTPCEYLAKHV